MASGAAGTSTTTARFAAVVQAAAGVASPGASVDCSSYNTDYMIEIRTGPDFASAVRGFVAAAASGAVGVVAVGPGLVGVDLAGSDHS